MRKRSRWFLFGFILAAGLVAGAGPGPADHAKAVTLTARLQGAQEVPPADPDAKGKVVVKIDVDAGTVCFDAKFDRAGTPNRGHIHVGAAGSNGPIVVPFFELVGAPATDPRFDQLERGRLKDCVENVDKVLLANIVAHPEGYYVNLHNTRYPAGAFRCQLER